MYLCKQETYVVHLGLQHKRACREVIKKKLALQIRPVRFNHVGLPRSGKTSFRRRLMREIRNIVEARRRGEKEQPSTGVAEAGGQVIIGNRTCSTLGAISSKEWSLIKDLLEEGDMLSQVFYQTAQDNPSMDKHEPSVDEDSSSHKPSVNEDSSSHKPSVDEATKPKTSRTKRFKSSLFKALTTIIKGSASSTTVPTTDAGSEVPTTDAGSEEVGNHEPFTDADFEEVFSVINDAMEADDWDKVKYLLEDLTLLISTDTGGQAEFLDLHASLVQGPSFNLLFSRLVDKLDSQFEMYYTNEDGVSTEKENSTMTVEEVLFQALSSIACFSGTFCEDDDTPSGEASNMQSKTPRHSKSKVMFVGTHADQVSKEEFQEKDKLLQKKIRNTEFFDKDIIEFASEDQLMLSVDNMNGSEDEMDGIRKVLERVIEKCFERVTIPASWLLFSLYMRSKKVRTMSLEECEKLAKKAGISRSELQEALWFLHHRVGVLLYYPEVEALKGTVICDIQVVFDSASNLIRNTFTFDKVGLSLSEKFREKAQFSLQDVVKATSGHTDALIPLENLVKLLEYLGILTAIPPTSTPSADVDGEPTYFMPCVLKSARASELSVPRSSDSDPAPLILRYDCGYVPVGVFPSMITNLVSQQREGWEMIERGLYKNKVQFRVGEDLDTVTLISHPRYFEIVVSRSSRFHTPTESLCTHVRSTIESTLNTVTSHMNYHFSMGYKLGFECPTHPGKDHFCIQSKISTRNFECVEDSKEKFPVCLADHPNLKVWFSQEQVFDHPDSSAMSGHPKGVYLLVMVMVSLSLLSIPVMYEHIITCIQVMLQHSSWPTHKPLSLHPLQGFPLPLLLGFPVQHRYDSYQLAGIAV